MPISENELMWSRSLPEEVEADGTGANAGVPPGVNIEAEADQRPGAAEPVAERHSVVRLESASPLEAILARLEINSLEIKLHLDALDERISRLEPHPHEPLRQQLAEAIQSVETPVTGPTATAATPPDPEALGKPVLSNDAKEKRWSHLIGPELDALMSMEAPAKKGIPRSDDLRAVSEPAPPVREQSRRGDSDSRAATPQTAAERPMRMSAAAERLGDTAAVPDADRPAVSAAAPLAGEVAAEAATVTAAEQPAPPLPASLDAPGGSDATTSPQEMAERPAPAAERPTSDPGRSPYVAPRSSVGKPPPARDGMSATFAAPPDEYPSAAEPRMWRGYRVRRLVWAVILLVLAAIPLAIWWRLSTEARDADAGDAGPVSQVDAGRAAPPANKPGAGEALSTTARHRPGQPKGDVGIPQSTVATGRRDANAAPVVRRTPDAGPDLATMTPSETHEPGGRTSSGIAPAGKLAAVPGGADEVPGTSGPRVRVPENVMAGHLLPTGDVGELPRGTGEVTAAVWISNTGRVEEVDVISGKQGLRQAAAHAIESWRYEPYVQNGVRVPVVTTASIRFGGETAE